MANGTLAVSQINMLSQSGTGIITITPPATNTNRTLTLPDSTGTILNSTGGTTQTALTVTNGASIQGLTVGRGAGAVATNTAVGASALAANQAGGTNNTAIGNAALDANTTGDANTAVGDDALGANTTASNNTAVGYQAGYSNTTAANVTTIGFGALYSNTTGARCTALGSNALATNTTAGDNTALGFRAVYLNTTGAQNIGVGVEALASNTTGSNNTAIGSSQFGATFGTLSNNTTGASNVAIGNQALASNTTASNNTAVGYQAGFTNVTGAFNTFVGQSAGYASTGSSNTLVGQNAGTATTGSNNAFFGTGAGVAVTSGASNTFLGSGLTAVNGSGSAVTTGSKNSILGNYSGNQGGLDIRTANNYIVLSDGDGNPRAFWNGANASFQGTLTVNNGSLSLGGGVSPSIFRTDVNGSGFHFSTDSILPVNETGALSDNTENIGSGNNRWNTIFAGTGTINTSDSNAKQDVADLSESERRVAVRIKGLIKKFRFKDAVVIKGEDARIHVGVIAQEVQAAFEAEGLDASRYGLFCSDTWYEVDGKASGDIPYPAETPNAVAVTRLGIRYDELLAFLIAAL